MYFIESKNLNKMTSEYKKRLHLHAKTDDSITGIPSGFYSLDAITKGFQPSSLTLVGGAKGMGKSSFAISLVKKMAIEKNQSVAFFSLRLSSENFLILLLSQLTKIDFRKIHDGLLNEKETEQVYVKMEEIKNVPLEFYEQPFLTVDEVEELLLFTPPDCLPKIIVIDSLEFISKNNKDKVGKILNKKELVKITFQLKELSKKFNLPIVLTTTINESIQKKGNKRPFLMNLISYAPIANFADLILLLYRPEYYRIYQWDDEAESTTDGEAEISIIKNVNGILDSFRLKFNAFRNEFDDLKENI